MQAPEWRLVYTEWRIPQFRIVVSAWPQFFVWQEIKERLLRKIQHLSNWIVVTLQSLCVALCFLSSSSVSASLCLSGFLCAPFLAVVARPLPCLAISAPVSLVMCLSRLPPGRSFGLLPAPKLRAFLVRLYPGWFSSLALTPSNSHDSCFCSSLRTLPLLSAASGSLLLQLYLIGRYWHCSLFSLTILPPCCLAVVLLRTSGFPRHHACSVCMSPHALSRFRASACAMLVWSFYTALPDSHSTIIM